MFKSKRQPPLHLVPWPSAHANLAPPNNAGVRWRCVSVAWLLISMLPVRRAGILRRVNLYPARVCLTAASAAAPSWSGSCWPGRQVGNGSLSIIFLLLGNLFACRLVGMQPMCAKAAGSRQSEFDAAKLEDKQSNKQVGSDDDDVDDDREYQDALKR